MIVYTRFSVCVPSNSVLTYSFFRLLMDLGFLSKDQCVYDDIGVLLYYWRQFFMFSSIRLCMTILFNRNHTKVDFVFSLMTVVI